MSPRPQSSPRGANIPGCAHANAHYSREKLNHVSHASPQRWADVWYARWRTAIHNQPPHSRAHATHARGLPSIRVGRRSAPRSSDFKDPSRPRRAWSPGCGRWMHGRRDGRRYGSGRGGGARAVRPCTLQWKIDQDTRACSRRRRARAAPV